MNEFVFSGLQSGLLAAMIFAIILLLHSHYVQQQEKAAIACRQEKLTAMTERYDAINKLAGLPDDMVNIVVISLTDDEVRLLHEIEA